MRGLRRFLLGGIGTLLIVVGAATTWFVVIDRFGEDYCNTQVSGPAGATAVGSPQWELPMSFICDFGGGRTQAVNEPRPIIFTAILISLTVFLVAALWWRVARSTPVPDSSPAPKYEGKHVA